MSRTKVRFQAGDRVEAVEHDDATRKPRKGGEIVPGEVADAGTGHLYARVVFDDGRGATFYQESGWTAWDGEFRWRLRLVAAVDSTGEEQQS